MRALHYFFAQVHSIACTNMIMNVTPLARVNLDFCFLFWYLVSGSTRYASRGEFLISSDSYEFIRSCAAVASRILPSLRFQGSFSRSCAALVPGHNAIPDGHVGLELKIRRLLKRACIECAFFLLDVSPSSQYEFPPPPPCTYLSSQVVIHFEAEMLILIIDTTILTSSF